MYVHGSSWNRVEPASQTAPYAVTGGGCRHSPRSWCSPPSWCIRPGVRSRARTTTRSPYLSPFYSPCLTTECVNGSSDFGQPIDWWSLSPALLVLIFPLGFRLTCYYYRKAYYRSFWLSPAGLRGGRATRRLQRRDRLPADPAEHPPVVPVRGGRRALILTLRRRARIPLRGRQLGPHRPRHGDHAGQRRAALAVHALVPLVPAHRSAAGYGTSPSTRCASGLEVRDRS